MTDHFVTRYLLPDWIYGTAVALLAAGLPLILVTAIVERGVRRLLRPAAERTEAAARGWRRLLTWPKTLLALTAAVVSLAMAGVVFSMSRALGVGPAAPLIARGSLGESPLLVLADAENLLSGASSHVGGRKMAVNGGRTLMVVAAAVTLVAAAILWWDLMRDEVTLRGVAVPSLVTVLGLFWLYLGRRTRSSEQSGELDSDFDAQG